MKYRVEVVQTTVLFIEADSPEEAKDIATNDYIWDEDTTFKMSIKTMGMIAAGIAVVVGGWYSLMQEIQEAKEKPVPVDVTIIKEEILKEIPEAEITRMEFDMKDQMIRQTIITTQSDIQEIKEAIEKIEDKLYNR